MDLKWCHALAAFGEIFFGQGFYVLDPYLPYLID